MKSALLLVALLITPLMRGENALPLPTSEAAARPFTDVKTAAPSHANQVAVTPASAGGLDIAVKAGPAGFPGVNFTPDAPYDLSAAGYVEAQVTNTSSVIINVVLRVDSGSDNASGNAYLKPGESGKARAYFATPGKGSKALNPSAITKLLLFIGKNEKVDRTVRLDAVVAGGRPGEQAPTNPDLVRTKPANGILFGGNVTFDAAKQLLPRAGAKAEAAGAGAGQAVNLTFTGQPGQSVLIRPVRGFWDLGDFLQVKIRVKNTGAAPASLTAQLTSRGDVSDFGLLDKPIAPGATADLVIPFIPRTPFEIVADPAQEQLEGKRGWGVKETPGARYTSHQTTGVILAPADATKPSSFQIVAMGASLPAPEAPPAWLGQRPPVAGEWVKTFEDNFDGAAFDETKWNPYSGNHWDQRVGFSKQNIILKNDGFGRLRIEKRDGFHNDDPAGKATTFATGWLDTYGKWTQRYGYYEVRVKLPTAPSMFPGFWLMPERGPQEWPKYRRTDTKDGGMEFDIFEGQSMWGPYRTTFGMHWDSYMKYHKTAGTSVHYNQPDKDGFLTIGMLWTPGHVSVYSQGRKGGSWDSPRIGSVQSYLIFDMLPGGFEYDPLDPAQLPAELVIDYVRVWQRKDLATAEDGPKAP
ncbi:glycoside hydrolase family 16 protein [Rariglobus hedericola]|uniref:Glycoside hydrolase family 16 protein n=1 Tax=Rariglobus hedericola TaxID=2597822 RepID=A0A556QGK5_9BACT|nr:glycoside hydrolase family 16 protein [Rariglobus hedericola]TSJ75773.1 glycoside hydrolase family 16 protein [Rariglobus hedericola]